VTDDSALPRAAYGTWASPIDAKLVATASTRYGNLRAGDGALYWLEARPLERGRSALVRHGRDGRSELTPAAFDARSRVYEYGGGAFCVGAREVYFVNNSDQNIHAAPLRGAPEAGAPRAVTQGTQDERFGDLVWDGAAVLAVRETHGGGAEPTHDLVRVDVAGGEVRVLHRGHDFYAAPTPARHGRLAFLVWDHPNMPWDGTQLVVADYKNGRIHDATVIAGGAAESIVQPAWCGKRLLFASDARGYWNLHAYDESGVYPVFVEAAEHAGPAWLLGAPHYVVVGARHAVVRRVQDGVQSLVVVDLERGLGSPLHDACSSYGDLARTERGVAFIAGAPDLPPRVVELDLGSRELAVVAGPGAPAVAASAISLPEAITFRSGNADAHAFFYPPRNGARQGLAGELPPLLVTTHGGPTSAASADLSWRVQFYTSRGWAVADVNYRGSTGYGRAYREQLNGAWGVADVEDCVACVRHLAAAGRVDANRVAIRGGSAGGYTTLAALAFTDAFRAGASHYGIGDLAALDRDTHKFESRYVGTLTGGGDAIEARSPLRHAERLNCPVIFLQGADDKIVPPDQAATMRDALAAKGIAVEHLLFKGEGHGFRQAKNIRRAVEAEHAFFQRVLGIGPSGDAA